jgi:hypothetical protein
MTARILRPDEYGRLKGTELECLIDTLVPGSVILAVEDEVGELIGCRGLFPFTHAEGTWIRPDHRQKTGVLRQLNARTRMELSSRGERMVWTSSTDEGVAKMLMASGGFELPGRHFAVPLSEKE